MLEREGRALAGQPDPGPPFPPALISDPRTVPGGRGGLRVSVGSGHAPPPPPCGPSDPGGGAGRAPRLVGGGQALLPTGHVTPTRTQRERPPSKQMRNPEDLRRPQCHRVGTARRARASGDRSHSLPRGAPLTRVSVSLMCGFQLGLIPIKRP